MSTVDSKWSCVVLLAGTMAHVITHGFITSFGILFIAIEDTYGGRKAQIAWISSIILGCLYLIGSGIGLVFLPTVVSVTVYFDKFRGIACGLALSGCGIGNLIFSPLTEYLLTEYGLKGTLLLLSGLMLNCIPCCMVYRPLNEKRRSETSKDHTTEKNQTQGHKISSRAFDALLDRNQEEIQDLNEFEQEAGDKFELQQRETETAMEKGTNNENAFNINFPPKCSVLTRYVILMKTKATMLFFTSQFFFIVGAYVPFIFVPDKAKYHGIKEDDSAWILSTIGITSIVGRIVLGSFIDRKFIDKKILFKMVLISSGLITVICSWLNVFWMLVVYAVIYGIMIGTAVSLTSVVLLDIVGSSCITDAIGLNYMLSGIGGLIGPPLAGTLFDVTSSYSATFLFAGGSMFVSGLLLTCL
ncbi:Major Facilitator superfamily [Mactra antiquata]